MNNEAIQTHDWKVLPHPQYSSNLAPTDFHLFKSLSNAMRGFSFNDAELKAWLDGFLNLLKLGTKIFLRIFELRPEFKQLFPFKTDCELISDDEFITHASRFMQAVNAAVVNINDLDATLRPLLFGLGRRHVDFRGFKPSYWDVFIEAFQYVWRQELKENYTDVTKEAWNAILCYMTDTMKEGYQSELNDRKKLSFVIFREKQFEQELDLMSI
ncbi:uncharacterized protein LOC115228753 [Octopus sinensis]|uniref:Uncharacterized protein LOC115228753 n=1 Tax=Octopus sinensis TaxID=2607531 RepID=A0A7E6EIV5_9MOLL|nr:uncharacterized protein LOC115228753 [Octopus sinensis]